MKKITNIFFVYILLSLTAVQLANAAALTVFNKNLKPIDVTIYWEGNLSQNVVIQPGGKAAYNHYSNRLSKIAWTVPGTGLSYEVAIPSPSGITAGEFEIKGPEYDKYIINFNKDGMYPHAPSRRVEVGFAKNKRIGQSTANYNPKL